ncbi:hypothetical protein [Lysinibacillus varians]|uniref:Lipoprotein n=1 Tax=Lysinibacillus varians TaxID=1145276 RepID=A0ABY2T4C2_9BACI|nr:hypothetical protein [Lysinibacillus varians]AHN24165.1 hypothetical protein T479_10690 [Lysinibacillus varians]TKI51504.1 hypothetical protein FC752_21710 [Lysinibacillus varians]
MLKRYFYISILFSSLALSGCINGEADNKEATAESLTTKNTKTINIDDKTKKTEEVKEVEKKEPVILDVTDIEKVAPIRSFYPIAIDAEITSPIGESKSYFNHSGDSPFKITVLNIGTESFIYKIQNVDTETKVANGILKSNESYEKIFDGFPKGAYVISFLIEEEGLPTDIKLKIKVEMLR